MSDELVKLNYATTAESSDDLERARRATRVISVGYVAVLALLWIWSAVGRSYFEREIWIERINDSGTEGIFYSALFVDVPAITAFFSPLLFTVILLATLKLRIRVRIVSVIPEFVVSQVVIWLVWFVVIFLMVGAAVLRGAGQS